jgi:hypothetical protein
MRRTVDRLFWRARAVLKSGKPVIGKSPPPFADDARVNIHFLSNRARAAALSRQQDYPSTLHVALRRARCSAASLKHLANFQREPNFSCFGNHPVLESRLTRKEKWALGSSEWHHIGLIRQMMISAVVVDERIVAFGSNVHLNDMTEKDYVIAASHDLGDLTMYVRNCSGDSRRPRLRDVTATVRLDELRHTER